MRLYKREVNLSSMDFIIDNLKSFLKKENLDFIYMELGVSFWDQSSSDPVVSSVLHSIVFFKNGKKGSVFFDKICDFDFLVDNKVSYIQGKIKESLSFLNKSMFVYSHKYWNFVTIKIDNDGKICVKFFYDLRKGKGLTDSLENFN